MTDTPPPVPGTGHRPHHAGPAGPGHGAQHTGPAGAGHDENDAAHTGPGPHAHHAGRDGHHAAEDPGAHHAPGTDPGTDPDTVRAFFGERAAGWDTRYPDDTPVYRDAVAELGLRPGQSALDAGCGTGRALEAIRAAVGPTGTVIGVDFTPEMLRTAADLGRGRYALLVEADAARLPVRSGALDLVFAAGLVHHVADPAAALREFARVCRPGGRLALFHPLGRAALAARHGHPLTSDDVRAEANLAPLLAATGWRLDAIDDGAERYLTVAVRGAG